MYNLVQLTAVGGDIADFISSSEVRIGVDHPEYNKEIVLDEIAKKSLQGDLKTN